MNKPKFKMVTDPIEANALVVAGKYKEHLPFWIRAGEQVWVLKSSHIEPST